ncbi:UNVERIFIED_CONTAM: putative disease resistance protein RGA1 [Sesamum calycinum]|uniref:Disease resistance protein RGA1 n=1 Tax=Sesamum calycinum TaxID=2727403 RepID=A0AAW2SUF4_9LAMI
MTLKVLKVYSVQSNLCSKMLKSSKGRASIQNWLLKLKDVAYDAENVLDRIATFFLRRRADSERGVQHKLTSFLSEEDSWFLFRQRAFTTGVEEESHIAIGKMIVKKCGGVPLAIKALGSLMRFKSHESEWLAIKESEIWQLSDDENDIFPALRLSYYNLAPQMRQCFAYCCLFPKDHVMKEKQLIQLWMANGFVPSQDQNDLYFSGHLIFKELVWRSFLDVEINFKGDVTCKMHDLMHDLAVSIMKHETCIPEHARGLKVMKNLYFVEIESFDSLLCTPPGLGDLTNLRELSIFIVGQDASHQIDQLKELNLGGSLSIGGLENVSNTKDAKKANLLTKNDLTSLLPSLTDLNLYGMDSLKYLDDERGLDIDGSISATLLGSLRFLTSLTSLKLSHIPELAAFPEGFLQNNNALENLQIDSLAITTLSNVLDNLSALKALRLYIAIILNFFLKDSRTSVLWRH